MRIIVAHNRYRHSGGEDAVFDEELELLRSKGHEVFPFIEDNRRIDEMNRVQLAARTLWSNDSYNTLLDYIDQTSPELVHFHNTLPLLSPSVYAACRRRELPIVQTLHNYRLICPNALLFRDGHTCEDCVGKFLPWPAVMHACYRDSHPASGVVAAMLTYQKVIRRWGRNADILIALTEFARNKFIQGGIPAERIRIKPNFIAPDPGPGKGGGEYALFVGRLAPEKGLGVLFDAWMRGDLPWSLIIVGDGPLKNMVMESSAVISGVEALGPLPFERVVELMKKAETLIVPSLWYEGFPRTVVEAFSVGLPVICSELGSLASIVAHEENGLHFTPGDAYALHDVVLMLSSDGKLKKRMGLNARQAYVRMYSPESNYEALMDIYQEAMKIAEQKYAHQ